jgi:hypothetical protein
VNHAPVDIETDGQVRLAFRLHVETRQSGSWRRLAEPVGEREDLPIPWHGDRIGFELAGILAGWPAGDGERFPAISRARGMPDDASDEVARAAGEDTAGFGHSHLSVRELLAYDWHQTITRKAVVADRDARFPDGGRAAHAMFWAHYDHELPSRVTDDPSAPDGVRVTWPWPAWAAAGREFLVTMIRLGGLAAADLDAVRGVFWFGEANDGH